MKLTLLTLITLLITSAHAQRYNTNVIKNIEYQTIEETNEAQTSLKNSKELHYRTVRVTAHKKQENGVLRLNFEYKSYELEIDKDVFKLPRGERRTTRLRDVQVFEPVCDGEVLTVELKSKTQDPVDFDGEAGVFTLTKTKSKSMRLDTTKYCNGLVPMKVVVKTL